jgi:sigma-B regulation protein RsbU (phosphoserine phosphatase)
MRYAALRNPSPADTLREVNRVISGDLREGTFVTAFFVVLHTEKRELVVASAGHNPLLILKAGTGECIPVKPKGIALGLDKGNIFNGVICEETLRLSPGDKVFMYTDGIIEARNSEAEQFGKGRLAEILRNSQQYDSQTTIKMIVDAVSYHAGEAAQYDDITAALISVK